MTTKNIKTKREKILLKLFVSINNVKFFENRNSSRGRISFTDGK